MEENPVLVTRGVSKYEYRTVSEYETAPVCSGKKGTRS
jgi:hypothetical protein